MHVVHHVCVSVDVLDVVVLRSEVELKVGLEMEVAQATRLSTFLVHELPVEEGAFPFSREISALLEQRLTGARRETN